MTATSTLRVVQLTPPGRGAIATILVEGPGAAKLLEAYFHAAAGRPLRDCPTGRLLLGRFGSETGEELVVRRTSDESVELHCHGGHAAVAMIEELLVKAGCRAVRWQDFVADYHQDPITAAAHQALADARTERTAVILLDQYQGALRRALREIERDLDAGRPQAAREKIDALLARANLGRHLVRPWQVVLTGRANVGKSSLINAVVGYPRAIVHDLPGTTRDIVTANTAVDGWPIELSDTAGWLPCNDAVRPAGGGPTHAQPSERADRSAVDAELTRAGVELARQKLAAADLVVLVFDSSMPWSESDQALMEAWPGALVVHNKSDLPRAGSARPAGMVVSGLTGEGIEALIGALSARLVPHRPPRGAAVAFTAEQVEELGRLRLRVGAA